MRNTSLAGRTTFDLGRSLPQGSLLRVGQYRLSKRWSCFAPGCCAALQVRLHRSAAPP
jgi:hypothetical protein